MVGHPEAVPHRGRGSAFLGSRFPHRLLLDRPAGGFLYRLLRGLLDRFSGSFGRLPRRPFPGGSGGLRRLRSRRPGRRWGRHRGVRPERRLSWFRRSHGRRHRHRIPHARTAKAGHAEIAVHGASPSEFERVKWSKINWRRAVLPQADVIPYLDARALRGLGWEPYLTAASMVRGLRPGTLSCI